MWDEARQAAASSPGQSSRFPTAPTSGTAPDKPAGDDDDRGAKDLPGSFDGSAYDSVAENFYVDYVADSPYDNVIDSDSRYDSSGGGGGGVVNKPFFIPDEDDAGLEDDADSPGLLARHLGVGGHGAPVADRLALLARLSLSSSASPRESGGGAGTRTVPKILPSLYFGDLRAGDAAATAEVMELCRDAAVQAFSLQYVGGEDGVEAGKGAADAADYEHEDVSVIRTHTVVTIVF